MSEAQTCPRRMREPGPWERKEGLDEWQIDRWEPRDDWPEMYWPEGHPKPATCSFCGGIKPSAAILLVESGWEVVATDKLYKRYLEPPGYHADLRRGLGDRVTRSPTPPVKLYVQHFSEKQIKRFNTALEATSAES